MQYQLKNLSIGYGKTIVSEHINATLQGGEMTCLLGPNGAGKSTLLRTLCTFQSPLSGAMLIDGVDIQTLPPQQLSRRLGVVLTDRVSVRGMSVRDMVAMGRAPYTNYWGTLTQEDNCIIDLAIQQCNIASLAHRDSTTLSDGERQKVMIAKALAQQTPIILLDEPTAFLDFPSKVETMLLLSRLAHEQGKAILISTHDLDLALQTADRLWLMGRNEQLQIGTPRQLADAGLLKRFFSNPNVAFDASQLRFTVHQTTYAEAQDRKETE